MVSDVVKLIFVCFSGFSLLGMEKPDSNDNSSNKRAAARITGESNKRHHSGDKKKQKNKNKQSKKIQEATKQLFKAVKERNQEKIREALANGANINGHDERGVTALYYADATAVLQLLIDNGCSVNERPESKSNFEQQGIVFHNHREEFQRILIAAGADREVQDRMGATALCRDIHRNDATGVEALVNMGACVNHRTINGLTPLHLTGVHANDAVIRILLKAGADVNAISQDGETPLHTNLFSLNVDNEECIEIATHFESNIIARAIAPLLEAGANSNRAINIQEMLDEASFIGPQSFRLLLRYGLIFGNQDISDFFPELLHLAAVRGNIKDLEKLLSEQCYSSEALSEACMYAVGQGHSSIVIRLLPNLSNNDIINALRLLDSIARQVYSSPIETILERNARYSIVRNALRVQLQENITMLDWPLSANQELLQNILNYMVEKGYAELVRIILQKLGTSADISEALRIIDSVSLPLLPNYQNIQHQLVGRLSLVQQILRRADLQHVLNQGILLLPIDLRLRILPVNDRLLLAAALSSGVNDPLSVIRDSLNNGADPNTADNLGNTCLWLVPEATTSEEFEGINKEKAKEKRALVQKIYNLLLRAGADPNTRNILEMNLVDWLVQTQQLELARLVVQAGGRSQTSRIETFINDAFEIAALRGNIDAVRILLQAHPSTDEINNAFRYAAGQGHPEVVRFLFPFIQDEEIIIDVLETVEGILRRQTLTRNERYRYTIIHEEHVPNNTLMRAIIAGDVDRLDTLLRFVHGDANSQSNLTFVDENNAELHRGISALVLAARYSDYEKAKKMVKLLLQHGANPHQVIAMLTGRTLLDEMHVSRPEIAAMLANELMRRGTLGIPLTSQTIQHDNRVPEIGFED